MTRHYLGLYWRNLAYRTAPTLLCCRYQVAVVALDGGNPPKSGSILVDISIADVNDNAPVFDNDTYEVWLVSCRLIITGSIICVAWRRKYNSKLPFFMKTKTWFLLKAAALKQQISKCYPQIQRTGAIHHIYFSQWPVVNVKINWQITIKTAWSGSRHSRDPFQILGPPMISLKRL